MASETYQKKLPSFSSNEIRIMLLMIVYAILLGVFPFLANLTFPRRGVLGFYAILSQVATLSFLISLQRTNRSSIHLLACASLAILSLGLSIPVGYDDIPFNVRNANEQNRYFVFITIWFWFCLFVISSLAYLFMRIVLATLLSGIKFARGSLRFSISNILIATALIFLCIVLVLRGRLLEQEYVDLGVAFLFLSSLAAPCTWCILGIDYCLSKRAALRLIFWGALISTSSLWISHLYSIYQGQFLTQHIMHLFFDGRWDARDYDMLGLLGCVTVVNCALVTMAGIQPEILTGNPQAEADQLPDNDATRDLDPWSEDAGSLVAKTN